MIHELDSVVLTEDIKNLKLARGDIGTVVLIHNGREGYEVEFMTLDGDTVAVTTLFPSQIRMISSGYSWSVRCLNISFSIFQWLQVFRFSARIGNHKNRQNQKY